jgi:hypothetical protein
MSEQARKIEFLLRLNTLNPLFEDLQDFLIAEGALSSDDLLNRVRGRLPEVKAAEFYLALNKGNFLMVDWEWTILPKEILKLTVVTRNNVREFGYSSI